jgi:hypothetical protein
MILPASYANGFAPRDGSPLYPELWRGCVGAWNPGLGPTGLTLRDWSGFGRNGTLTNGPTWVVANGRRSIAFDGSDDSVICNNVVGAASFSISAWINPTSLSFNNIASHGYFGNNGFDFYAISGGSLAFYVRDGGAAPPGQTTSGSLIFVNRWTHVAATFTASTASLFINGVQASLSGSNNPSIVYFTNVVSIGRRSDGFGAWAGSIDDVRVYNRAISQAEIRLLSQRNGIAYEMAPRRRSRVSVLASLRYNIFTGNVGSLEVIGAS